MAACRSSADDGGVNGGVQKQCRRWRRPEVVQTIWKWRSRAEDGGVQKQADDGGVQKQTERGGFVFAAVVPDMMLMLYS